LAERTLSLSDLARLDSHTRLSLLLDVADARRLAGRLAIAAATYRDASSVARQLGDHDAAACAAIGLHLAGVKTGPSAERDNHAALLATAAEALDSTSTALAARVQAALAQTLHHSLEADQMAQAVAIAEHAVEIAHDCGDPSATADALQALHDVAWRPGRANRRLDVLDHLAQEASERGAARVRLRTQLLRAQALLELGDPHALAEADAYCAGAGRLGDPLSRWQSLSRRAATTLLTGRLDDAADLASRAERVAEDLGDADAAWIGDIQRWELARFTGERATYRRRRPGSAPPVESWPPWPAFILAERGDHDGAASVLAGFSAHQAWGPGVNAGYDLWFPAIAAEAAAAAAATNCAATSTSCSLPTAAPRSAAVPGSPTAVPWTTTSGCSPPPKPTTPPQPLTSTLLPPQHLRLGAPRWAALSRQRQDRQQHPSNGRNRFRRDGAVWALAYGGVQAHMPHAKGLQDIAVLLAHPGQPVPTSDLAGTITRSRGEPALDRQALAAYRARLRDLDDDIADADSDNDPERAARARAERDALVTELTRSVGRGGRPRRLGDDTEKARKTVTIRIQRTLRLLDSHHPALASHLREAVRTGTTCSYQPAQPSPGNYEADPKNPASQPNRNASRTRQSTNALRPELIRGVLVPGIGPYLAGLAVRYVENLHGVVLKAPALALGTDRDQRDCVLVVGDHVVHLDADGPPAGLERAQKPSRHLIDALIVTAERTPSGIMPPDVLGEESAFQRFDITMPEGRISVPQQILVGVCHPDPSLRSAPADTGAV
jgi:hypothetical protein